LARHESYNTKQREAILGYIRSLDGEHVTAAQIAEHFKSGAPRVGRSTVYRYLGRLTDCGVLRKFFTDGVAGACYQHEDGTASPRASLHLKCENCGGLFHLECETASDLQSHVLSEHAFNINPARTVLYGRCGGCRASL